LKELLSGGAKIDEDESEMVYSFLAVHDGQSV